VPVILIRSEIGLGISERNNRNLVNKFCRIIVQDNGIGFEQKYAEEIFVMLKRLHHHTGCEGGGAVGLRISLRVADPGMRSRKRRPWRC